MSSLGVKIRSGTAAGSAPGPHRGLASGVYGDDDTQLIRQAQAGRWEAFAEVASRYDRSILMLALRLSGSEREARDLFQKALLAAYRELNSYRFQCSFYVWIYRVAARACIEFLDKRSSTTLAQGTGLEAALQQLSPRERVLLELKQYFGLKLETIAAILGISEETARNIFLRATLALRLQLEDQGR